MKKMKKEVIARRRSRRSNLRSKSEIATAAYGSLAMTVGSLVASPNGFACSVCFGDPNSLQSKALTGAVLFLLIVIVGILAAIAWTAFSWSCRARKISDSRMTVTS